MGILNAERKACIGLSKWGGARVTLSMTADADMGMGKEGDYSWFIWVVIISLP
jgi:hypothetical protein